MTTLRARLALALLVSIVPLVTISVVALHFFVQSSLVRRFDDSLSAKAEALVSATKWDEGQLEFDYAGEAMPQYERSGSDEHFELWTMRDGAAGEVVARSGSLGTAYLNPPTNAQRDVAVTADLRLPSGRPGRSIALRFAPRIEGDGPTALLGDVLLMVASSRKELDETMRALDVALVGGGALLVTGVALAIVLALRRGLRPVATLAARMSAIDSSNLATRLDAANLPRELRPIAQRTNELLERLRSAFERERRLTAAAAHELRTPIAEIRAVTELALQRERDAESHRRSLADVLEVAIRMESSVAALLQLARLQAGTARPNLETVDAAEVVRAALERARPRAAARGVAISMEVPSTLALRADRALLRLVADNLCANAAEYASAAGGITSAMRRAPDGSIEWRFENTANGERRTPDAGSAVHLGIGLPLVAAAATALGATFAADERAGRFTATLRFAPVPG